MKRFFDHINILVIPTDACNLRCEYCFHNEYISPENIAIMDDSTVEQLLKITLPFYKSVNLIWHGGEPLVAGEIFYKKVIEFQKKHNVNETHIKNSIQTNLTLMDNKFAAFLKENNFGLSTSFDGVNNEILRHNTAEFYNGKRVWEENGGKCGVIMVISSYNINTLIDSYEHFKKSGTNFIMNPYTKSLFSNSKQQKLELSGEEYSDKMIEFFDYWIADTACNIYVKYFHEIIDYILFKRKNKCNVNSCLGKWVCVRPDGTVTPCNRYFPEKYNYGNIFEMNDIAESFESVGFKMLLTQAIERRNKCKNCEIFDYCSGGCNNIALVYGGVENNNHEMCIALRNIYSHINDVIYKFVADTPKDINPILEKAIKKYKNMSM